MAIFYPKFYVFSETQGQGSSIDYNNGTITQAKMTVTYSGFGPIALYLTANGGSNWEAVSNGVLHTFSNTGTDLRWRIVGFGNTITGISIINYH